MSSSVKESAGQFPPAHVRLGPVLQLADRDVVKVSGTMDDAGRAHLLVAMKSPKDIDYLVVESDNIIRRERLSGFSAPTSFGFAYGLKLHIATDAKGRLRAIVEDNALILEEGRWKQAGKTPCLKYVRAGNMFYCAFISPGKDVGAPRQWELFALGGYPGAAIIVPWVSYPEKLVVLREDGGTMGNMAAIDPDTKGDVDTRGFALAGDGSGALHLVFRKSRALAVGSVVETRYVRLPSAPGEERTSPGQRAPDNNSGMTRHGGIDVPLIGGGELSIAADPDSGTAVLVLKGICEDQDTPLLHSREMRDGKFGPPWPLPLTEGHNPLVAPAGSGSFHASIVGYPRSFWSWTPTTPIYYLSSEGGAWSSPVEIGEGIPHGDSFLLISDASRRAFSAWATRKGLEGRWVELEEIRSGEASPKD